ncbi:uncharacterized protein EV420DRAFT_1641782 [Desarmillaria tabescens]|uniref:EamA domain-containing protein n=1 Tax=Armillaria tabescens TaxID=1929756 RepID=A0AA39KEA5_ARMTA|nr:uncharacterized protein EV420DRAFT_1641782 [Desarmillaria tabescens]KAK0459576.1 hypothetical protein EV420DRAFT_1641782 [Desarmillaria tabescens]
MPSMHSLYIPFLLAGMILTGSSNSLWSKWQDMQCVENCDDTDVSHRVLYEQPVWQTLQMFVNDKPHQSEKCYVSSPYCTRGSNLSAEYLLFILIPTLQLGASIPLKNAPQSLTGAKVLLLWIPAACDLTGTTLMNVGLLYTPRCVSSPPALVVPVQSLVYTCVSFHSKSNFNFRWVSLIVVMSGVGLVGFSGSLIKDAVKEFVGQSMPTWIASVSSDLPPPEPIEKPEATTVLVGIFFILFAQVFTATQFVVEEKIMGQYSVPPLVAVGYEGLFGAISILLILPILATPSVSKQSAFFDIPRGWHQMIDTPSVLYSGIAIACSISLFNYFGLSVTRHVSATARSLTDTCRTLSIWIISLGLGWEKLLWPVSLLQVLGFSLLVYGTFMFNGLVPAPAFLLPATTEQNRLPEEEGLLSSPLDETAALPADLGQSGFDVVPEEQTAHARKPSVRTD